MSLSAGELAFLFPNSSLNSSGLCLFIHSFNKFDLSTYIMPGTIWGATATEWTKEKIIIIQAEFVF
jgi:hypothetical protein